MQTQTASTPAPAAQPAASAAPAATAATGSSAPAYVQLSSQRSEEAAQATAQQITSQFGSLFGGRGLEIQRVDLADRGIFYRVRLPADSLTSASTICASVKASGGDCFAQ